MQNIRSNLSSNSIGNWEFIVKLYLRILFSVPWYLLIFRQLLSYNSRVTYLQGRILLRGRLMSCCHLFVFGTKHFAPFRPFLSTDDSSRCSSISVVISLWTCRCLACPLFKENLGPSLTCVICNLFCDELFRIHWSDCLPDDLTVTILNNQSWMDLSYLTSRNIYQHILS